MKVSQPEEPCEVPTGLPCKGLAKPLGPIAWRVYRPWKVAVALLVILIVGFWTRYRIWLVFGGAESSYLLWAREHYFGGGIVPAYLNGANELLRGDPWSSNSYLPGYSAFLAAFEIVGVNSPQRLRLAQAAFESLTILPLYYISRRIGLCRLLSLFVCSIYVTAPLFGFGSVMILAEALSPLLLCAVMALALWSERVDKPHASLVTGIAIALATMVRPDLILLIAPVALWISVRSRRETRLPKMTALIGGFALLILAWGGYNQVTRDEFRITPPAAYYNLYSGLGQRPNNYGYVLSDARAIEQLTAQGIQYHTPEAERYWRGVYLDAWRKHPGYVISTIAWRMVAMPLSLGEGPHQGLYFERISGYYGRYGIIVLLLCLSILLRRRLYMAAAVIAFPLVYALLSLGFIYFESRYIRYGAVSFLLAAAVVLRMVWDWMGQDAEPGLPRRLPVRREVVAGVLAAGLAVYGVRELAQLETAAQSTVARGRTDALFGRGAGRGVMTDGGPRWVEQVADVTLRTTPDGDLGVVTGVGRSAYQAATELPVNGLAAISVDYTIAVEDGQIGIGVLSGDESRFLAVRTLPGTGTHNGSLVVAVQPGAGRAKLVLMNARAEDGRSSFTVEALTVRGLEPGFD